MCAANAKQFQNNSNDLEDDHDNDDDGDNESRAVLVVGIFLPSFPTIVLESGAKNMPAAMTAREHQKMRDQLAFKLVQM
jgi:hypothetical protein